MHITHVFALGRGTKEVGKCESKWLSSVLSGSRRQDMVLQQPFYNWMAFEELHCIVFA